MTKPPATGSIDIPIPLQARIAAALCQSLLTKGQVFTSINSEYEVTNVGAATLTVTSRGKSKRSYNLRYEKLGVVLAQIEQIPMRGIEGSVFDLLEKHGLKETMTETVLHAVATRLRNLLPIV